MPIGPQENPGTQVPTKKFEKFKPGNGLYGRFGVPVDQDDKGEPKNNKPSLTSAEIAEQKGVEQELDARLAQMKNSEALDHALADKFEQLVPNLRANFNNIEADSGGVKNKCSYSGVLFNGETIDGTNDKDGKEHLTELASRVKKGNVKLEDIRISFEVESESEGDGGKTNEGIKTHETVNVSARSLLLPGASPALILQNAINNQHGGADRAKNDQLKTANQPRESKEDAAKKQETIDATLTIGAENKGAPENKYSASTILNEKGDTTINMGPINGKNFKITEQGNGLWEVETSQESGKTKVETTPNPAEYIETELRNKE